MASIFNRESHGEYVGELIAEGVADPELVPWVTINDAIGEQGSRDYAAPFDSVVHIFRWMYRIIDRAGYGSLSTTL